MSCNSSVHVEKYRFAQAIEVVVVSGPSHVSKYHALELNVVYSRLCSIKLLPSVGERHHAPLDNRQCRVPRNHARIA